MFSVSIIDCNNIVNTWYKLNIKSNQIVFCSIVHIQAGTCSDLEKKADIIVNYYKDYKKHKIIEIDITRNRNREWVLINNSLVIRGSI